MTDNQHRYADINGDGFDDRYFIGSSLVAYNDQHESFDSEGAVNGGNNPNYIRDLFDLNDDGSLDWIGNGVDTNILSNASGGYSFTNSTPSQTGPITIGNLNGDGAPDAVVVNTSAGTMTIYRQDATTKTPAIRSPKISNQIDARNALRGLSAQQRRVEAQLGTIGAAQSMLSADLSNLASTSEGYMKKALHALMMKMWLPKRHIY